MTPDPQHWPFLPALAGVVRTAEGSINWGVVIGSICSALIVWVGNEVIDHGKQLATNEALMTVVLTRIAALEQGNTDATRDRYRAQDATRDFGKLDSRLESIDNRLRALEQKK